MRLLLVLAALVGFGSAAQVCPENQEFSGCWSACPLSCDNYRSPPSLCTQQCISGCGCKTGFILKSSNRSKTECIESKDCPNASANETVVPIPIKNLTVIPIRDVKECNKSNNEVYSTCASSCSPTCKEPNKDKQGFCTLECIVGCVCDKEFVKNHQNGECVKPEQCPPADSNSTTLPPLPPVPKCEKANQVWRSCGTACPPTCAEPNRDLCTKNCKIGCQCDSGYLLNEKGDCVEPRYCPPLNDSATPEKQPQVIPICPPRQKWVNCGSPCPLRCNEPPPVACQASCKIGCVCENGLALTEAGDCIEPDKCPPPSNSSVTSQQPPVEQKCDKPRQKWHPCALCPPTCKNQHPPCPLIRCQGGCICEGELVFNDAGECVEVAQCQPLNDTATPGKKECPPGQTWGCGSACPLKCNEPPPTACNATCKVGCSCEKGLVLTEAGDCVDPSKCPPPSNSTAAPEHKCEKPRQKWGCGLCPPSCKNLNPPCPRIACRGGCECEDGLVFNDQGDCVEVAQCPQLNDSVTQNKPPNQECPPGQEWETCGSPCPLRCNEPPPIACVASCHIGCSCKGGLVLNGRDCIEPSKCPPPSNSTTEAPTKPPEEKCDKPRQKWGCGLCSPSCNNLNPPCPRIRCLGGCECEDGLVFNDAGVCVEAAQCPPLNDTAPAPALTRSASIITPFETNCTKPNESFRRCGSACPATCPNHPNAPSGPCPKNCVFGCFCNSGFVRSASGDCVDPKDCSSAPTPPIIPIASEASSTNKTDGMKFTWLDG